MGQIFEKNFFFGNAKIKVMKATTEGSTLRRIHKPYVGLSSVKITRRYPRNGQMALLPHF